MPTAPLFSRTKARQCEITEVLQPAPQRRDAALRSAQIPDKMTAGAFVPSFRHQTRVGEKPLVFQVIRGTIDELR
jgi:hypothetical protein